MDGRGAAARPQPGLCRVDAGAAATAVAAEKSGAEEAKPRAGYADRHGARRPAPSGLLGGLAASTPTASALKAGDP